METQNILSDYIHAKGLKQINTLVSILEMIILLFLDYVFLEKLNIDVKSLFLSSWGTFLQNLFTPNFFIAILGFILIYITLKFAFPLMLPLIIFRIIAPIYILFFFALTVLQIVTLWTYSKITKQKIDLVLAPNLKQMLSFVRYITVAQDGKIGKGEKFENLEFIANDIKKDNGIYEWCVKITALLSACIYLAYFFNMHWSFKVIIIILLSISFLMSYICYYIIMIRTEIDSIINEANTNNTIINNELITTS